MSQPTFARIIDAAYKKIAKALIKGKANRLEKKPAAEAPVNINNFLCFPFILLLTVKNIRTAPNKEKIINGDRKRKGPLINSPTAGTKNILIMTTKTPIRA